VLLPLPSFAPCKVSTCPPVWAAYVLPPVARLQALAEGAMTTMTTNVTPMTTMTTNRCAGDNDDNECYAGDNDDNECYAGDNDDSEDRRLRRRPLAA
jgi:hypothetical protein